MSRPVARADDDRVDLAVVWPNHGELTFTVSRRLASNVFRRWLQFQAQNTRRHQVEQAARYERSQRPDGAPPAPGARPPVAPPPASPKGPTSAGPDPSARAVSEPENENLGQSLAAAPMPAPETLQLDESELEVLRLGVRSGDVDPGSSRSEGRNGRSGLIARRHPEPVVPVGDMAATTHFDPTAQAGSDDGAEPRPMHHHPTGDDDWRNTWAYSDDDRPDQDGGINGRGGRGRQPRAGTPTAQSTVSGDGRDEHRPDRSRRAAAETQVFPDAARPDIGTERNGTRPTSTRDRGRRNRFRRRDEQDPSPSTELVPLGDGAGPYRTGSRAEEGRVDVAADRPTRSRGGYLDGIPEVAGDAAPASSESSDRRARPESAAGSTPSRHDHGHVPGTPVPQISGARLQSPKSARRSGGPATRSPGLTDSVSTLWSDAWHRHRISIMASISLVVLLVVAVSSLLSRDDDDTTSGAATGTDIAIPTRIDDPREEVAGPAAGVDDPAALGDGSLDGVSTGGETEPNSPLVVEGGGPEGGGSDGGNDPGGGETAVPSGSDGGSDQETTATTSVQICHSNYGGCVPVAPDVDCEGDGDGPAFLSEPVAIFGEDVYDLDTDGDREACEPDQPRADREP